MAKIKYKNAYGDWEQISATDIGAATDSIIARGIGTPQASENSKYIKEDTMLYIDDNPYSGNASTITEYESSAISYPLDITKGGTGAENPNKAKENLGLTDVDIVDIIYPIGSIYMSTSPTNPSNIWPGTKWVQISGRFLVGVGDNGESDVNKKLNIASAGSKDGETWHKLTEGECAIRTHTHSFTQPKANLPGHTHKMGDSYCVYKGSNLGGAFDGAGGWGTNVTKGSFTKMTSGGISATTAISISGGAVGGRVYTTNDSATNVTAHNNLPPYFSVYIWQRVENSST